MIYSRGIIQRFAYWVILHSVLLAAYCSFQNQLLKLSFRDTISVPNSLVPDQARRFVGLDLGTNCLQRLSAEDTSRQLIKAYLRLGDIWFQKARLWRLNCPA